MLAQADTALDVETGDMLIKVGLVFLQAKIINKKYFQSGYYEVFYLLHTLF